MSQASNVSQRSRWLPPLIVERCNRGLTAPRRRASIARTASALRRRVRSTDHANAAAMRAIVASADARLWTASAVAPERTRSVGKIPAMTMPVPAAVSKAGTARVHGPPTRASGQARARMPAPVLTNAAVINHAWGPNAYSLIRCSTGPSSGRRRCRATPQPSPTATRAMLATRLHAARRSTVIRSPVGGPPHGSYGGVAGPAAPRRCDASCGWPARTPSTLRRGGRGATR